MTILQLEYFRDLVNTGSIVQTAQNFYISQPAVSKALKKLEEELGGELFDRIGKSIRLNTKGEEFYRGVNTIFSIIERNKAENLSAPSPQEIALLFFSSLTPIVKLLGLYSKLRPSVSFRLLSCTKAQYFDSLHTADFSFARKLSQIKSGYYVPLPVMPSHAFLLLSPKHPLSSNAFLTYENLYHLDNPLTFVLVLPTDKAKPTEYISLLSWGLQPKIGVTTDDRFAMMALVAQGEMAAIVPYSDGDFLSRYTNLSVIPLYKSHAERAAAEESHHYIFGDSQKSLSELHEDFLHFVLHSFHLSSKDICVKNEGI